jgi:hypothetical protein
MPGTGPGIGNERSAVPNTPTTPAAQATPMQTTAPQAPATSSPGGSMTGAAQELPYQQTINGGRPPQRFARGGSNDFEDSESAAGGPGGQCPPGYVRGIVFHFIVNTSICACRMGVVFSYKIALLMYCLNFCHPIYFTGLPPPNYKNSLFFSEKEKA